MHIHDQLTCNNVRQVLRAVIFKKEKLNNLSSRASLPRVECVFFSSCHTAQSQGGVKQDVGRGGLDRGGGDIRHLVVIKLVPALFEDILTVGCVMAAIQTPVVVLVVKKTRLV